ncbi:FHA domain-containing protein [Kitasatospora sp. NPDC091335]|uniref:FHA domain-containing protein n=1 Tax=Kitasatospora sp. NPDC091335 TaxID=3364085 RepID=UPI00380B5756
MTPPELPTGAARPTGAVRPSDAERDQALGMLRDGAGSGRLSHDTFLGRMDVVLHATSRGELDAAVAGLPTGGPVERFVLRTVGRVSAFGDRLGRAWRTERLPGLNLPQAGTGSGQLTIGRLPGSGLRLHDASVSRHHAELRHEAGGWMLYDLGSTNGTHVNGRRIAGGVRVQPGDQVRFGNLEFRLAAF